MSKYIKRLFDSAIEFLHSYKKTVLLIILTAVTTIAISTITSIWLSRILDSHVPSLGTIRTIGVEAYWDKNLENEIKRINWGTIWPGSLRRFTLYLRSMSNIETTLSLNTTNWNPANISEYMNLSWNYNGAILHSGETIQVTLTLTVSSSSDFLLYLVNNDVKEFSFDIIISTS